MMEQDLLKSHLFAFYFGSAALGEESELTFGYYDKTKYHGELQWNPVVFRLMFGMRLDDVLIGGKSLGVCSPENPCIVTIDSGTSLLAMPRHAYKKLELNGLPTEDKGVLCDSQD
jgi:hypothetical protein